MTDNPAIQKNTRILSYISVAAYLVLSILFPQERIVLRDGANFMVGMINAVGFYLPLHRYSAYVNQILPVLGLKAGMSLSNTIFLYSLNIALFYLILMVILDRFYRDYRNMLGLAVFLWVLTYESFYMPISELPLGISFVFVWLAHLRYMSKGWTGTSLIFLVIITLHVIFSHPLILGVLMFLWLFFALRANNRGLNQITIPLKKWTHLAILITAALILLKILIIGGGVYGDISKIGKLENLLINFQGLYLNQDANFYFKKYVTSSHLNGLLVLIAINVLLVLKKDYRILLILDGCCALFTAIYLITHPEFHVRLNMEIYFMVVAFYLAFLLAYLATSANKDQRLISRTALVLSAFLIIVQVTRVYFYHGFFKERTQIMNGVLDQMEKQDVSKAVIPFYKAPMKDIIFIGAVGNESLLLSELRNPDHSMTFVYILADSIDRATIRELAHVDQFLNNEWEAVPLRNFNPGSFNLSDEVAYLPFDPVYPQRD